MVWASPCIFETEFFCRWCFWALFCTTISSEIHPHPYPTVPLSGLHLVQACECQLLYYLLFKFFIIIHVCEHTVSIKCTTIQSFLSTLLWKWSMNAEKSIWIHPFFQWVMKNSLLLNLKRTISNMFGFRIHIKGRSNNSLCTGTTHQSHALFWWPSW